MANLVFLVFIAAFIYFIVWLSRICDLINADATRMDFKQWIDIYNVNPDRWYIPKMSWTDFNLPIYKNNVNLGYINGCAICFGFLGDIKYRRWAKKCIKHDADIVKSKKDNAVLIEILNNAQLDIDVLRVKAQKEMDEAKERIIKGVQDAGNLC